MTAHLLFVLCLSVLCFLGCRFANFNSSVSLQAQKSSHPADEFKAQRREMVERQIRPLGIKDKSVLEAMRKVPRHRFVPAQYVHLAYADHPLPIGYQQTISQPYIVAYMTEAANISAKEKVLEIGTGSGYQAAVLAEIARDVFTIEIIPELAERARQTLSDLGYKNVHVKTGNGYLGWPEQAPFDAIVVTAAPDQVPLALLDQLALNGKLVIPVGTTYQEMMVITKTQKGLMEKKTIPVRFVPMTGKPSQ